MSCIPPMQSEVRSLLIGSVLATLACVSWGASAVVGRFLYGNSLDGFDPLTVNFYRFLLGSIVLNVFLICAGRWSEVLHALKQDWAKLILAGLFGVTLEGSFQLWSLAFTTAGRSTLFGSSSPIFTLIFSFILIREKPRFIRLLGAVFGASGMLMLFFCRGSDLFGSGNMWIGDVLAMLSSVSWAVYTITNSGIVRKYGGLVCTGIMMPVGTILLLPIVWWRHGFAVPASSGSIIGILYMGLISCGAAYLAWAEAGKYLSPGTQGAFGFMNLISGLFFSILFLHEKIGCRQCISVAIILLGMYLMVKIPKNTTAANTIQSSSDR